jgi:mono/diheme cytochrome c family protein
MRSIALLLILALAGCGESMDRQNRTKTYGAAKSLPWRSDGEAIPLVDGVVSQDDLTRAKQREEPPAVSRALLDRGRARYDIFCAPCHGLTGAGDGFIVQRGFPAPATLGDPRLLRASARHLLDVVNDGRGVMYGFGDRVAPQDQWAIVAYVRALQHAGAARGAP